jgi:hypothetical protein
VWISLPREKESESFCASSSTELTDIELLKKPWDASYNYMKFTSWNRGVVEKGAATILIH